MLHTTAPGPHERTCWMEAARGAVRRLSKILNGAFQCDYYYYYYFYYYYYYLHTDGTQLPTICHGVYLVYQVSSFIGAFLFLFSISLKHPKDRGTREGESGGRGRGGRERHTSRSTYTHTHTHTHTHTQCQGCHWTLRK